MAEEEESAKDAEEERDRWVEGVTGGPVGSELDQDGGVYGPDVIFNKVWGYDYLPNSRTLDQQVSQLRKRIEADPKNPAIIRTVHGAGYRYDP